MRDVVFLITLEGLLQRTEDQTTTHQIDHHHHEHSQDRLPFHDCVWSRSVRSRVYSCDHAGRSRGDGETRQKTVTVHGSVTTHRVLYGGHAGLNQTGLNPTGLDLLWRDYVRLNSHWREREKAIGVDAKSFFYLKKCSVKCSLRHHIKSTFGATEF